MAFNITGSLVIPGTTGSPNKVAETITQSITTTTEHIFLEIEVAPSTTDLVIPISNLGTLKGLYMKTNRDLDVKLNGSTAAVIVNPELIVMGGVSSITVTNQSGTDPVSLTVIAAS